MDDMDTLEEVTYTRQRYAVLYTLCGFVLSVTVMFGLYLATKLSLFLMAAMIQLLPALLNLILLLPKGQTRKKLTPDEDEVSVPRLQKAVLALKNCGISLGNWYARWQSRLSIGLILIVTAAVSYCFWAVVRQGQAEVSLSYGSPVFLVGLLVIYIVLDKLCKRAEDTGMSGSEKSSAGCLYDLALLHSMHSALVLGSLSVILLCLVSFCFLLGFVSPVPYLIWGVEILFGYETVCMLLSLAVRLIRKEFAAAPELIILLPGRNNSSFSVISYLEKNTGITMRSLWSIRLIKEIIPYCLMGIALLLWLFSGIVKIESYQQGAFYRLGKLQPEPLKPGLHFTLPWPIDQVDVYDTETVSKMTIGYVSANNADNTWTEGHGGEEYKLLLGGGKELVSINLRVEYKISDLEAYVTSSASPEKLLQAAAYETVTNGTIGTSLETLLASDRKALAASVQQELMQRMQRYDMGLSVVSVVLESIHPPVEIAQIYQQIISAGIDAEKLVLDAEAAASVRIANAKRSYNEIISSARMDYFRSVAKANSSVAEFMASVEADSSYTDQYRYYKYLQALSQSYSKGKLIIVGDGIDQNNIFIGKFSGKANGGT